MSTKNLRIFSISIVFFTMIGCSGGTVGTGTRPPPTTMFDVNPINRLPISPPESSSSTNQNPCTLPSQYKESSWISPNQLIADFDGDNRADRAVLVESRITGKLGIALCSSSAKLSVLGAGNDFGNGGDDFSWADEWSVIALDQVDSSSRRFSPKARFGLYVLKNESGGGVIYLSEHGFRWLQYGD